MENERTREEEYTHVGLRLQSWYEPDHEKPWVPTRGSGIGSLGGRKSSESH